MSSAPSTSIRFPSKPQALEALWLSLADETARTQALHAAIARGRVDFVMLAASIPLPVDDFVGRSENEAKGLVLKNHTLDVLSAIQTLNPDVFDRLLSKHASRPFRSLGGKAVSSKNLMVFKRLVAEGLDAFQNDSSYDTSLAHMCASHGWHDALDFLESTDPGRMVRTIDGKGRTVLHTAARYGQTNTVKWLLEMDADVHVQDNDGRVPLFHCLLGHIENTNSRPASWEDTAYALIVAGATPYTHSAKTPRSASIMDIFAKHLPGDTARLENLYRSVVNARELEAQTSDAPHLGRTRRI